jgi:endonuclease/exonuclease/phosphatase family protein
LSHADRSLGTRGRLCLVGLVGLIAALGLCLMPGAAAAKKGKKDRVKVIDQNLYIGGSLDAVVAQATASHTDGVADAAGTLINNVNANDFNLRAQNIASFVKKKKVDLLGLQEAALWRLQIPTDGGGPSAANPNAALATTPLIDYIDTLLGALNKKALSKKGCKKFHQKHPNKQCYRGYKLASARVGADAEQPTDLDHNNGPDGKTYDVTQSATAPCPGTPMGAPNGPGCWLQGNDDVGVKFGEPPAAQCADNKDNDGDGLIDYGPPAGGHETSGPAAGGTAGLNPANSGPNWDCESRADNSETDVVPGPPSPGGGGTTDPSGLPQDANFDHHANAGHFGTADDATPPCGYVGPGCPTGAAYDGGGQGLDASGIADCNPSVPGPQDTSPDAGPALGAGGTWPFSGYDGDEDPGHAGSQVPVCLFHGVDADARLTNQDAIIARKGAGVKTSNPASGNYKNQVVLSAFGGASQLSFNRGWTSVDAKVRGKNKVHFVDTHLEDLENGTVREDQASELIAPGGPATLPNTVLVGDLNSDPSIQPGPDLVNDAAESNIAINRLTMAGFGFLSQTGPTFGHGQILNNPGDNTLTKRIDYVLTNSASIGSAGTTVLNRFSGLWQSDHVGVLTSLKVPGGKKKK